MHGALVTEPVAPRRKMFCIRLVAQHNSPANARICRIECVMSSHTYSLVWITSTVAAVARLAPCSPCRSTSYAEPAGIAFAREHAHTHTENIYICLCIQLPLGAIGIQRRGRRVPTQAWDTFGVCLKVQGRAQDRSIRRFFAFQKTRRTPSATLSSYTVLMAMRI